MARACLCLWVAIAVLAEDRPRVEELVARLGDADPARREAAQADLVRLIEEAASQEAEHAVEEGTKSSDPEVGARCEAILRAARPWQRIAVVGNRSGAVAFDVEEGVVAWRREGWCDAWVGPRRRGCRAYVAPAGGGLECLDLASGRLLWALYMRPHGVPTGDGGWVAQHNDRILYISLDSGEIVWNQEGRMRTDRPVERDVDSNGNVVFVQTQGGPRALDARTGDEVWNALGVPACTFHVLPGAVYLTGLLNGARAIERRDPATGALAWHASLEATSLVGHPVIEGDPRGDGPAVLVHGGSGSGTAALDVRNGRVLWKTEETWVPFHYERGGAMAWVVRDDDLRHNAQPLLRQDLATGAGTKGAIVPDVVTSCIEDEHRVYVAGEGLEPVLLALDSTGERALWRVNLKGCNTEEEMILAGGRIERIGRRLLLVCEAGGWVSFEVIDPESGRVLARQTVEEW